MPLRSLRRPAAAFAAACLSLSIVSPGSALTLAEAVTRALANGPDAMIARLEAERAGDAASAARSAYWPSVSVSSAAGYSNRMDDKLRAVDAKGVERRYGLATLASERGWLNVFLHQMVLDLRTWRDLQKSELEAEIAEEAEREQRETIAFTTMEHYLDVLRLERHRAIDTKHVQHALDLDRQAGVLLEAGRLLAAEREAVAVHLSEVRMQEALSESAIAHARSRLALAIGLREEEERGLVVSTADVMSTDGTAEAVQTESLETTPEIRVLDLRQKEQELALLTERAGRYPTLAIDMGYRHLGTKRFDNYADEFLVAVDFALPIFDGFRSRYSIDGASKDAEIARLRYRTMLAQKRARVRELDERWRATAAHPELAARRARAAEDRLRVADLNLRAGRGTLDDALAARTAHAREATQAIDAEFDRILLWATLQREIGKLSSVILADSPGSIH
jgi:outer membrane protein TolC